ncbi:unnamed protein product [Pedinophyceae sp. YPF-701]|nr:unnamed protein product [Pedinophyceae sp. YPF-701]
MGKSKKPLFYAVRLGRRPGVYGTWDECKEQVDGFKGAKFKSFMNQREAEEFVKAAGGQKRLAVSDSGVQVTAAKRPRADLYEAPRNATGYVLHFDGGARGNPGVAGSGAVLREPTGRIIAQACHRLPGTRTNNEAEWLGLLAGLRMAAALVGSKPLLVQGDSDLVVRQVRNEYKVSAKHLLAMKLAVERIVTGGTGGQDGLEDDYKKGGAFPEFTIEHIPRAQNGVADALSNVAMDGRDWEGVRDPDGGTLEMPPVDPLYNVPADIWEEPAAVPPKRRGTKAAGEGGAGGVGGSGWSSGSQGRWRGLTTRLAHVPAPGTCGERRRRVPGVPPGVPREARWARRARSVGVLAGMAGGRAGRVVRPVVALAAQGLRCAGGARRM